MTAARRNDFLAVALLALLPAVFFGDVLSGRSVFFMRDLTRYYHPAKKVLHDIVARGEFPYWNPFFSAGQPMAANPEHEVFYPLNWLVFLPDFELGFRLLLLAHISLALVAMHALLRSMRCRPSAAAIGAIAYGMGGLTLSYLNLLPCLFSAAWLPLTCLFARRFLRDRRRADFAIAASLFGLQAIIGEPTTLLQTAMLIGAYAVSRAIAKRSAAPILLAVAIGIGGAFVGAVQLLPAVDHARDSVRSRGIPFDVVSLWSFPAIRAVEPLFPNFLGHVSIGGRILYWGGSAYEKTNSPFLFSIYSGLLVAVLALSALVARAPGWRLAAILILASLVLALGANTPLLGAAYRHGLVSLRYFEKFVLIGAFAAIVMAARAFDALMNGDRRLRRIAVVIAAATTAIALLLALASLTPRYAALFMRVWHLEPSPMTDTMIALSRHDWLVATLRGGALVVLLAVAFRVSNRIWAAAAIALLLADLAPVIRETTPRADASLFRTPPIAAQKLAALHRDFRVFHEAEWDDDTAVAGEYSRLIGARYDAYRNAMFPVIPSEFGLATVMEVDYDMTQLLPTADFTLAAAEARRNGLASWPQPFAAMSNAWVRAVYRPFADAWTRARGNVAALQPVAFLPLAPHARYFFARQLVTIHNRADFLQLVRDSTGSEETAFVPIPAFAPAAGVVRRAASTANTIDLDVESAGRGFLVISVTPHKYWRVTLDGTPVDPVITNLGYQGLVVPAGRHAVAMRYRNPLVAAGFAITLAALLALAIAASRDSRPRMNAP